MTESLESGADEEGAAMKIQVVDGESCVTTGELNRFLGVTVGLELLESLGLRPYARVKKGLYWKVADLPAICMALAHHFEEVAA